MGKGEIAGNQLFFPFPTMFSTFPERELIIKTNLLGRLQSLSNWTDLKFCRLVATLLPSADSVDQDQTAQNVHTIRN